MRDDDTRPLVLQWRYQDETESMHRDGFLAKLDLAFSRDQPNKIYVQDRMRERECSCGAGSKTERTSMSVETRAGWPKTWTLTLYQITRERGHLNDDDAKAS